MQCTHFSVSSFQIIVLVLLVLIQQKEGSVEAVAKSLLLWVTGAANWSQDHPSHHQGHPNHHQDIEMSELHAAVICKHILVRCEVVDVWSAAVLASVCPEVATAGSMYDVNFNVATSSLMLGHCGCFRAYAIAVPTNP